MDTDKESLFELLVQQFDEAELDATPLWAEGDTIALRIKDVREMTTGHPEQYVLEEESACALVALLKNLSKNSILSMWFSANYVNRDRSSHFTSFFRTNFENTAINDFSKQIEKYILEHKSEPAYIFTRYYKSAAQSVFEAFESISPGAARVEARIKRAKGDSDSLWDIRLWSVGEAINIQIKNRYAVSKLPLYMVEASGPAYTLEKESALALGALITRLALESDEFTKWWDVHVFAMRYVLNFERSKESAANFEKKVQHYMRRRQLAMQEPARMWEAIQTIGKPAWIPDFIDLLEEIEPRLAKEVAQLSDGGAGEQEAPRGATRRAPGEYDALLNADTERNGYPPLEENLLHDPLRGHWDLWPHDATPNAGKQVRPVKDGLMARDPAGDIQRGVPVCIDFGTSSTVVALRENGRKRLLRVGVQDWQALPRARDFENPTALEFVDAAAFSAQWRGSHWRPKVSWKDLKCSHQARNDISRVASSATLFSIISDLKTWARNAGTARALKVRDQKGAELLLAAPAPEETKSASPTLDPLAIYAFHLGLAINNQYRGNGRIYHEYYLSFPVAFDTATRKRIRDSFALGLERSLPESLGRQTGWRGAAPFAVHEGAEEPVAYAAAALAESGLEPDDRGVAFGVFDFGGGTTDFAFGLYRWATDEEERTRGWERVIHLLDVTGDDRLGGEALLRELAIAVITDNAQAILEQSIPFAMPDAGTPVPAGLERVFADSLIARANATHLAEAMRPLWEEGPDAFDREGEGLIHVRVQGHDGNEQDLELRVDKEKLLGLLHDRILAGVAAFFTAFRQAFKRHNVHPEDKLHIFPAGNACRSPLVPVCFTEHMNTLAQQENFKAEHFLLHEVRLPDDTSTEALTLKTGVALGLLDTVPGESVGICRVEELDSDMCFRSSFGVFRRGRLAPVLTRFSAPGEWAPLGQVRADLRLIVGWSASPLALEGQVARGDPDCREQSLVWSAADAGRPIFARTAGQDGVELALGNLDGTVDETTLRTITLGE